VARDRIPESVVPHSLIVQVLSLLADFRAQASPRPHAHQSTVSSR
jgi:hypothetical protein